MEALKQVNAAGARILWHRDTRGQLVENVKQAFSWFGSKKKSTCANDDDDKHPVVKAQFKLVDNDDGIPEIRINKRGAVAEGGDGDWELEFPPMDEEAAENESSKRNKPDKMQQINIAFKRIHTVVPDPQEGLIILNILTDDGSKTKEWTKFSLEVHDQGAQNMFVHHLQVLMEWDKQRRSVCGELEYDETSAASSLKARAQKAAHMKRREIEMKQQRRTREERKAKYVQESGGLKYTALAMTRNAGAS